MSAVIREALSEIATRFPILPARLADALDEHGGDAMAWASIVDGKLLHLEIERLSFAAPISPEAIGSAASTPASTVPPVGAGVSSSSPTA